MVIIWNPSSARIAWTLLYFGHDKTKILDIGIREWHKKGLAITRDIPTIKSTTFVPKVNANLRIEAEELVKKIDTDVIIDARTPQEFMAGRIPNSILIPFTDGIGQQGFLFKEKEEMEKFFEEQEIPKDKVICYCALGHRAAYVFTQLKLQDMKMSDYTMVHLLIGLEEDFLLADLRLRLLPQIGHCDIFENIFSHPGQK